MAKQDNIKGVATIEIGAPGDGVVGGALTEFSAVVLNSLNLTGGEATEETIATEQDDNYLTVNTGSEPAKASFKLYEITGAEAVMLMGGEWDGPSLRWSAPRATPNIYLSVVITTEAVQGRRAIITFPYAKVVAKYDGNITKSELLSVDVSITANTPVSAAGVEGDPYTIQWEDV